MARGPGAVQGKRVVICPARAAAACVVMKHPDPIDRSPEFERAMEAANAVAAAGGEHYVLKLYITGNTPRSSRAIRNLRAICDRHLRGHYDLEVIDIFQ